MGRDAELLLRSALALPQAERSEIACQLLESLELPPEARVEEAWREEVAARVATLDAGKVETIPWEEIRDRLQISASGLTKARSTTAALEVEGVGLDISREVIVSILRESRKR